MATSPERRQLRRAISLAVSPGRSRMACRCQLPRRDRRPRGPRLFGMARQYYFARPRTPYAVLFSDVGEDDAPTRIRVGSHFDIARLLAPAGEAGMAHLQLTDVGAKRDTALATGEAGTVYLCHPFLIHAAQRHRGTTPRFMSQPPLAPATPLRLERADGTYSPVEVAIREALQISCRPCENVHEPRKRRTGSLLPSSDSRRQHFQSDQIEKNFLRAN